uniref:Uncharacterized protein n=1 Tax=Anas platyrhynchos TaxID=8839 RepID=A0A8B9SV07_ANAPL
FLTSLQTGVKPAPLESAPRARRSDSLALAPPGWLCQRRAATGLRPPLGSSAPGVCPHPAAPSRGSGRSRAASIQTWLLLLGPRVASKSPAVPGKFCPAVSKGECPCRVWLVPGPQDTTLRPTGGSFGGCWWLSPSLGVFGEGGCGGAPALLGARSPVWCRRCREGHVSCCHLPAPRRGEPGGSAGWCVRHGTAPPAPSSLHPGDFWGPPQCSGCGCDWGSAPPPVRAGAAPPRADYQKPLPPSAACSWAETSEFHFPLRVGPVLSEAAVKGGLQRKTGGRGRAAAEAPTLPECPRPPVAPSSPLTSLCGAAGGRPAQLGPGMTQACPLPLPRDPRQPDPHHGQAGAGPVHALHAGDGEGRPGGGHQQEAVAGDHQGAQPAHLHHQRCLHAPHPVSSGEGTWGWVGGGPWGRAGTPTTASRRLSTGRYMKYLYPYECEKRGLSNPNELQAAIDSNRREGRRQGFGSSLFTYSPGGTHGLLSSPKLPVPASGTGLGHQRRLHRPRPEDQER